MKCLARFFVPLLLLGLDAPASPQEQQGQQDQQDSQAKIKWSAGVGIEIANTEQASSAPEGGSPVGTLPNDFEPSGALWHPRRQTLILVSDEGTLAELARDGSVICWSLPGDLEALTLADPSTNLIYVGLEHPDGVIEFDLERGAPTGNAWDLTPWMKGPENRGLEALTFIQGEFWAGHQGTGQIFRFHLPDGGKAEYLGVSESHGERRDLSGLHYDRGSDVLFAIHDREDVLVEYRPPGTFLRELELPGKNQEGIAVGKSSAKSVELFVAHDSGRVMRYPVYALDPGQLHGGAAGHRGSDETCPTILVPGTADRAAYYSVDTSKKATARTVLLNCTLAATLTAWDGSNVLARASRWLPWSARNRIDIARVIDGHTAHPTAAPRDSSIAGLQMQVQVVVCDPRPLLCCSLTIVATPDLSSTGLTDR